MKCKYEHDDDCCNAGADQYMCKCKKPCEFIWPLSNADHIRSMSDEELAKLLLDGCRGSKCEDQPENEWGSVNCFQCRMEWLKQPYKEEV